MNQKTFPRKKKKQASLSLMDPSSPFTQASTQLSLLPTTLTHTKLLFKTVQFSLTAQLLHLQPWSYLVTNTTSTLLLMVPHGDSFVVISLQRFSTLRTWNLTLTRASGSWIFSSIAFIPTLNKLLKTISNTPCFVCWFLCASETNSVKPRLRKSKRLNVTCFWALVGLLIAILNFFPNIGRILFRKRWEELFKLRRNQDDVLIPLIKARRKVKQERE